MESKNVFFMAHFGTYQKKPPTCTEPPKKLSFLFQFFAAPKRCGTFSGHSTSCVSFLEGRCGWSKSIPIFGVKNIRGKTAIMTLPIQKEVGFCLRGFFKNISARQEKVNSTIKLIGTCLTDRFMLGYESMVTEVIL